MLKICLTGSGYTEKHFSDLANSGFEISHYPDHLSQEALHNMLPEYDAYVLGGDERLTETALEKAIKLRLISFVGTGYSSFVDELAAEMRKISIRNTPAVMAPAVAEHTIGLIIGLQRKLFEQNWRIKNECILPVSTQELSSTCVGIIGLGEIGSRIAKILRQSFGSEVIYHSRSKKPSLEDELAIRFASLEEIFLVADILVLALPTNANTEYFISDRLLEKTKPGVIIINTAGARLIDPHALRKNIDNNQIASVAFDGYYIEPLPKIADDAFNLLSLPDHRFVVTPHTAAKTSQSWNRMVDMAINNVIQFFYE